MGTKRTSSALTEIRTVLSRARTALGRQYNHEYDPDNGSWRAHSVYEDEPEGKDMVEALTSVVRLLERWERG